MHGVITRRSLLTLILARRTVARESVNEWRRMVCCVFTLTTFCFTYATVHKMTQVAMVVRGLVTLTHSKIVLIKDVPL